MNAEHSFVGRTLWLQWVLANVIGWTLGLAVGAGLVLRCGLALTGFIVGLAQWLVLRRQIRRSGLWILATGIGWDVALFSELVLLAAWGFFFAIAVPSEYARARLLPQDWIIIGIITSVIVGSGGVIGGLLSGGIQGLIFRKQGLLAGRWVVMSTLGWFLAWGVGMIVFIAAWSVSPRIIHGIFPAGVSASDIQWGFSGLIGGAVIGAVGGALTGIPLVRILSRHANTPTTVA